MSTATTTPTIANTTTATVVSVVGAPTTNLSTPQNTAAASSAATNSGAKSPSRSPNPTSAVESVTDLLKEVQNPGLGQARLRAIWGLTKSSRVRKAIASHPNSDPKTMAMAARLYLKEVVTNPSFEVLNFFAEEKFVQTIWEAYKEPGKWNDARVKRMSYKDRELICRTLLISPYLDNGKLLDTICSELPSSVFQREVKDEKVRENVKKIVENSRTSISLVNRVFLYKAGLLKLEKLESMVEGAASGNQWITAGSYIKILKSAQESGLYKLAFEIIRCCNPNHIKNISKAAEKGDKTLFTDDFLKFFADLYRDFLVFDVCRMRREAVSNYNRYGWVTSYTIGQSGVHSRELAKMIWDLLKIRSSSDIFRLSQDMKLIGFDKDPGVYKPKPIYPEKTPQVINSLLGLKDDELESFLGSGLIFGEVFACPYKDTDEFRLVERINRINEEKFAQNQPLIYKAVELKWPFSIIFANKRSRTPAKYDVTVPQALIQKLRQKRHRAESMQALYPNAVLPSGSGLIPEKTLIFYGEKAGTR